MKGSRAAPRRVSDIILARNGRVKSQIKVTPWIVRGIRDRESGVTWENEGRSFPTSGLIDDAPDAAESSRRALSIDPSELTFP